MSEPSTPPEVSDADLAQSILRKLVDHGPDDWCIRRYDNGSEGAMVAIEGTWFDVSDAEADYLERLHPSR